jgi:deoxyribodipyrimidine photo-lyase
MDTGYKGHSIVKKKNGAMENPNDKTINLFWFRRDLRLTDNHGLFEALKGPHTVQCIFIFDTDILNDLTNKADRRISFIYETVKELKKQLIDLGSDLWVYYGKPIQIFNQLFDTFTVGEIFTNNDYEPYAIARDKSVKQLASQKNIPFKSFKDQVIFEKNEVVKADGKPYTVFTPYMRQWKNKFYKQGLTTFETPGFFHKLHKTDSVQVFPGISRLGFEKMVHGVSALTIPDTIIQNYESTRDLLALEEGTSRLSVHLRFGTLSIRQLVNIALNWNQTYLNELIWREFYMQILWHFPQVVTRSFKPAYEHIPWNNNADDFEKWCSGKTGYPIVDAAMHQLLETGFMHNRARMIVSSFLTKHLLIDWRKGETFFAQHLLDYELSSNNGGWQWAASSGCDAVPYFRIFNPYTQTQKFDKDGIYIKRWKGEQGIFPVIEHQAARQRCLHVFKKALNQTKSN